MERNKKLGAGCIHYTKSFAWAWSFSLHTSIVTHYSPLLFTINPSYIATTQQTQRCYTTHGLIPIQQFYRIVIKHSVEVICQGNCEGLTLFPGLIKLEFVCLCLPDLPPQENLTHSRRPLHSKHYQN